MPALPCEKPASPFDAAYTSYLKRAVKTLNYVLDRLDEEWIPVYKSWRLNEKHYGSLQGLNKSETAARYGDEQVHIWRRSFDIAPAPTRRERPGQSFTRSPLRPRTTRYAPAYRVS